MKCIIIDDEPHAIGLFNELSSKISDVEVVGSFEEGVSAFEFLNKTGSVDIIFSDVDMPELNGIDLAKLLRPFCRYLIFITAHSKYALDAFGVNADGFLLKPLNLLTLMEKISFIRAKNTNTSSEKDFVTANHLFVKGSNKGSFIKIAFDDIVCIDGNDHFLNIVTPNDKVIVYLTMKETELYLNKVTGFFRINKSTLISLKYLSKVEGNRVFLDHKNEKQRDIGDTYRKKFQEYLHNIALLPTNKKA